jgi:hypothetical protein
VLHEVLGLGGELSSEAVSATSTPDGPRLRPDELPDEQPRRGGDELVARSDGGVAEQPPRPDDGPSPKHALPPAAAARGPAAYFARAASAHCCSKCTKSGSGTGRACICQVIAAGEGSKGGMNGHFPPRGGRFSLTRQLPVFAPYCSDLHSRVASCPRSNFCAGVRFAHDEPLAAGPGCFAARADAGGCRLPYAVLSPFPRQGRS